MKDTVQQRDLYCTHSIAIFIRDTKAAVFRGSPCRVGARRYTPPAVLPFLQSAVIITPFLETT
jgi:hypothetical protein